MTLGRLPLPERPAQIEATDAFEDALRTVHVESSLYVRLQMRAPFGVHFDTRDKPRIVAVTQGPCWLVSEQVPQPLLLAAGDCLLLKADAKFSLQDELGRKLVPCDTVLTRVTGTTVVHGGDGALTEIVAGALTFDATAAEPLLALMPLLVHVQLASTHAQVLQSTLDLIGLEALENGLGAGLVVTRLLDVLFVQAVRAWSKAERAGGIGALAALKDRRLGAAIRAMHADLARPWTVESLAREAGVSRSSFAVAFKSVTGESPLDYLTGWRIYRAKALLRASDLQLMAIAQRVGYETDTALSRAFRRHEGIAPGEWRRQAGRCDLPFRQR
jgi:AraC-like DNA-binding protein